MRQSRIWRRVGDFAFLYPRKLALLWVAEQVLKYDMSQNKGQVEQAKLRAKIFKTGYFSLEVG